MNLDKGIFTISLDFELIWGNVDRYGPEPFRQICINERAIVIDRLLDLFSQFDVAATWCVLGHLLLPSCSTVNGQKHPDIVRPVHHWARGDWFAHDPCGDEGSDPTFYGRDLVDKIRSCRVPQEVGCHSFSHVVFGDAGCSRATAESELAACVRLAREMGIEMRSFAFPRNRVGHLDVLREFRFACYRGPEPHWYERRNWPKMIKQLAHLWDVLSARTPPAVLPQRNSSGLWNIPGSMLYTPVRGRSKSPAALYVRRHIPATVRVTRACKGLDAAAQTKRVFHLWFHPTDIAEQTDAMCHGLRAILEHADKLRERRQLRILSMGALTQLVSKDKCIDQSRQVLDE